MIEGFQTYFTYMAIRAAFLSNYDYFKYHGTMKLSNVHYEAHKNKWSFVGLGRKFNNQTQLQDFVSFAYMYFSEKRCWIGNLVKDKDIFDSYKKYIHVRENPLEFFGEILNGYKSLDEILEEGYPNKNNLPKPFERWLATSSDDPLNCFSQLNYIILIDSVYEMIHFWNEEHKGNYVWDEFYKKIEVYKKFYLNQCGIHKKIVKEIIQKHFTLTK